MWSSILDGKEKTSLQVKKGEDTVLRGERKEKKEREEKVQYCFHEREKREEREKEREERKRRERTKGRIKKGSTAKPVCL